MNILRTYFHPEIVSLENKTIFTRYATRSIAVLGGQILLMYTARYDDYSLPGGGLDEGEDMITGMKRELIEETGAQNIVNIKPFGAYEEYRPWHKADYEIVHMISYCYTCEIQKELGAARLESYEINNGMQAKWMDINIAIKHNLNTMAKSDKKGMSIVRETYLLQLIASDQSFF